MQGDGRSQGWRLASVASAFSRSGSRRPPTHVLPSAERDLPPGRASDCCFARVASFAARSRARSAQARLDPVLGGDKSGTRGRTTRRSRVPQRPVRSGSPAVNAEGTSK